MRPSLNALLRLTAMLLTAASFQAATPALAQTIASSRSGLVLFSMPPDRLRVEENGYTRLRSLGADGYDIFIRPPFDVTGSAADAVEMHARWLAGFYRVQPAGAPTTIPHPGRLDVSVRAFFIGTADVRRSPVLPDVPTYGESGYPGFDIASSSGVAAPAGTLATTKPLPDMPVTETV